MPDPPKTFSGIFVSYRREDSAGHAGRLYDTLIEHFGKDRIFMDVDTIEPGDDFVAVIENAVASCEVLIAVIGRHWLERSGDGQRPLESPTDFVRIEIAAALKRGIRVIPVLVQRASMPAPADLPEDLVNLSRRNALEVSDLRWQFDVNELIGSLSELGIPVVKSFDQVPHLEVQSPARRWHRRLGSEHSLATANSDASKQSARSDVGNSNQPAFVVSKKLIGGVVAGVILLAILVTSIVRRAPQSRLASNIASTKPVVVPQAPKGMVYIPGGKIQLGYDPSMPAKTDVVEATVEPFFLDIYEVTCEQYQKFLDANREQSAPPGWKNRTYSAGWAHKPVTGINWDEASAFAVWSGKRLPLETEWEFAARGNDGRLFPWGTVWKGGLANTGKPEAGPTDGGRGLAEVGSYKGASPFGVYDMVGNAWEWTATDFRASSEHPVDSRSLPDLKVIRGGSWASRNEQATTIFRRGYGARGEVYGYSYTGFRLVQDIAHTTSQ